MRILYLPLALILVLTLAGDIRALPKIAKPRAIEVEVRSVPFDNAKPADVSFGRLKWRGGLLLKSPAREFGGYSGLAVTNGGRRLIAVSDAGTWLIADLEYRGVALNNLKNARIGPLRARNGRQLLRKKFQDAEEIALWKKNGRQYALIAFERAHRVGRFPFSKTGIDKPLDYLKLPKELSRTTRNKGLEALTILTSGKQRGTVLAFAEHLTDKKGYLEGWLIRGKRSSPVRLKQRNGFSVTGLTTLKNGNVLVLERNFSVLSGIRMRIRELKASNIKPHARLDGKVLIQANMRYNIDNMEGISAHINSRGEEIISLISDDNFNRSGFQKTLLLQFALE